VADVPGDQGGMVKVQWRASSQDDLDLETVTHYSVWRATDPLTGVRTAENDAARLVDADDVTIDFAPPALRVERAGEADYYWELVGTQSARYFEGYRFTASTRADSTAQAPAPHQFQVLAHTSDPFTYWPSNVMGGHSVDNLAPAAPLLLTAQRVSFDVHLRWNRADAPDLAGYTVYRATSPGVDPTPINFVAESDDSIAVDANAPATTLYYIVTAKDLHGNQSAPSNEASVTGTIGDTPAITKLALLDNMPNPFAETTTLRIGLPKASAVQVDVFDVAGRRVASERTAMLPAGWREISLRARDQAGSTLPSGVYFCRIRAAGETITRKMVIAR
jgi:hypothetical protein